jgi:hypothetical protein
VSTGLHASQVGLKVLRQKTRMETREYIATVQVGPLNVKISGFFANRHFPRFLLLTVIIGVTAQLFS